MGSLEQVGYGIPHGRAPNFNKIQSDSGMDDEDLDFEPFEDEEDEEDERETNVHRVPSRMPMYEDDDIEPPVQNRGIHICVHNGTSVYMRVNSEGEAEFNYGGRVWSKSPPPSLSKTKIKGLLESLRILGVDTEKYERSLGSVENYSAPVSMLVEDDIQHSFNVIKALHEEKNSLRKRKTRRPEPTGPIIISDPDFENRKKGSSRE